MNDVQLRQLFIRRNQLSFYFAILLRLMATDLLELIFHKMSKLTTIVNIQI